MPYIIIWLLCGIVAAMIAAKRHKNVFIWLILGILFGPFGIAFALFAEGRKCPYCHEEVHPLAVKCPKCHSAIADSSVNALPDPDAPQPQPNPPPRHVLIQYCMLAGLFAILLIIIVLKK
jgi:hypothetical protein